MLQSILIPFLSIAFAEFLDKSQIMIVILASRTKQHTQLFCGVMLAFIIVDGSAILAGSLLTGIIPSFYIKLLAGIGFIIFGLSSLRKSSEEKQKNVLMKNPFLSGLGVIFLSEWGDKTQIASGLFAIRYSLLPVFIGTLLALGLLSLTAIYFGKFISGKFKKKLINKISGIIFLLIGSLFLFSQ